MEFEKDGIIHLRLDERGEPNYLVDSKWDDGVGGQIKQILIWHSERSIYGIQTIYERRGEKLISKRHGGSEGNFEMIKPKKPLTWLSGRYRYYSLDPELIVDEEEAPWNYCKLISSLKFGNNEEVYGPFGYEEGTPFIFNATTEITGFHGFSLDATSKGELGYISAIGLYIKTDAVGVLGEPSMSLLPSLSSISLARSEDMIEGEHKQKLVNGS